MGMKLTFEDQFGYSGEKYIKVASAELDLKRKVGTILVEVWSSRAASKVAGKHPLGKTAICLGAEAEQQAGADTRAAWIELEGLDLTNVYALLKEKKLVYSPDVLDLTQAEDVLEA